MARRRNAPIRSQRAWEEALRQEADDETYRVGLQVSERDLDEFVEEYADEPERDRYADVIEGLVHEHFNDDLAEAIEVEYEAFGPGTREIDAESGLKIDVWNGDVEASEWTLLAGYVEDPELQDKWSRHDYVGDLRKLLGDSYEAVLWSSEKAREEAIVEAAIEALGEGRDVDEMIVDDLWE